MEEMQTIPVIFVTNHALLVPGSMAENMASWEEDYLAVVKRGLQRQPYALVLREKDLNEEDYTRLAEEVFDLCSSAGIPFLVHGRPEVYEKLEREGKHPYGLHMPLSSKEPVPSDVSHLGFSVHSKEELQCALSRHATYLFAGHVFATDCKKGLPPRGLSFLKDICTASPVPVFAIGGIHTREQMASCVEAGASGVCMMSDFAR